MYKIHSFIANIVTTHVVIRYMMCVLLLYVLVSVFLWNYFNVHNVICIHVSYNNNNNDRLTAFDPGQPG